MLSWRDMKHPRKGGAEIVTDIYLSGLAKKGHEAILFSASFPGCKDEENFNGYKIIRKGNQANVWLHGLRYARKNQESFDKIIDQVNTIPFLTPIAIKKEKRVAFFHQLCKNVWFWESKFPISLIGYLLESIYLRFYKNTNSFVVSNSTKKDLVKYCGSIEETILVLDNQIDFRPIKKLKKKDNYFIFVGRLNKSKRVEHCIDAMSHIDGSKLLIIGDGPEKENLERYVRDKSLSSKVEFLGRLDNKKRNDLMSRALAILVTSVREGWGLIVTEANANGTLAITYDIEGLRDANKKGLITKKNNPLELAGLMKKVIRDRNLLLEKSKQSLEFARTHSDWNKNIRRLEKWLRKLKSI